MWLRYRNYVIGVTVWEVDGIWVADVCIRRVIDASKVLKAEVAVGFMIASMTRRNLPCECGWSGSMYSWKVRHAANED
jgi:hypothetical protein